MTRFLISFPGSAMEVSAEDLPAVAEAAHAVTRDAKDAGVYVSGGGIDDDVAAVLVGGDGSVSTETYPQCRTLSGGFTILELPSRDAALEWAARIARACRCAQEVRQLQDDPQA